MTSSCSPKKICWEILLRVGSTEMQTTVLPTNYWVNICTGDSKLLRCRRELKCLWNTLDLKEQLLHEKGPTPRMTPLSSRREKPFLWFIRVISIRSSRPWKRSNKSYIRKWGKNSKGIKDKDKSRKSFRQSQAIAWVPVTLFPAFRKVLCAKIESSQIPATK